MSKPAAIHKQAKIAEVSKKANTSSENAVQATLAEMQSTMSFLMAQMAAIKNEKV
jgi:hypothetical protein